VQGSISKNEKKQREKKTRIKRNRAEKIQKKNAIVSPPRKGGWQKVRQKTPKGGQKKKKKLRTSAKKWIWGKKKSLNQFSGGGEKNKNH